MLKVLLGLILILTVTPSRPDRIYQGEVVRSGEVVVVVFRSIPSDDEACKLEANKGKDECKYTILDIPKTEYPEQWKIREIWPQNGQVKELREPEVGDVVKAQGEHLVPVEPCTIRRDRSIYEWVKNHPGYSRMPNALLSLPDDCQPWYEGSWK